MISPCRIILTLLVILTQVTYAQKVNIENKKFVVNGKEIFFNGANTPWSNWNDFGGNYNGEWWNQEFKKIKENGGNSTRIWISCDGEIGFDISENGLILGTTQKFWEDLDNMFLHALNNKIYIKAVLISFDHFKNSHPKHMSWRNMINSDTNVNSLMEHYVIPFVKRYKSNPYLWSIDACNEIEWANQDSFNGNISWDKLQYFVARVAVAVHENSDVLVTLGSAAVKWNSDAKGCEGNYWSDDKLRKVYDNPNAFLDFYSPHYYGWVVKWFGNFALDKSPSDYLIDDKPCVIGENPAGGVFFDKELSVEASEMFIKTYRNSWCGLMPWTSNGVDKIGNIDVFASGLKKFNVSYPELVNPLSEK